VNASETQKVDGTTLAKPIKANPLAINIANANLERDQTNLNLAHAPLSSTEAFVEKRFEASRVWLETGAPNTVTLQIMTITKDDQLKTQLELLNRQLDGDKLYLYRKNQDDQHYTVVLYGAYQQRAEALSALEALPLTIQDNNPQIRTIAGINRDIQQTQ
jgi:septal ring-binding cell division protein DamX